MAPKIAIVIYTQLWNVAALAEAEKRGIEEAGGTVEIFQVAETLSDEILAKIGAPKKPDYPIITPDVLATFDGFLVGISTRFGGWPAQFKTFWDSTSGLWIRGGFVGKYVGIFISTGMPGGGQGSTFYSALSTFVHHGLIIVPLGYGTAFTQLSNLNELHGGSPYGAGTFAGPDGSRQITLLEREIATIQGKSFWNIVKKTV